MRKVAGNDLESTVGPLTGSDIYDSYDRNSSGR